MIKLKKFWNCEWRKNNCVWTKFIKFPSEIIFPSVLKYLRHPWCKRLKETELGSPSSSRLPALAVVPNLQSSQHDLGFNTPRLCCRAEAGRYTSCWGLQSPLPQEGTERPGVLQLCGSLYGRDALELCTLVACVSEHSFRGTSRKPELFGQNSWKMA